MSEFIKVEQREQIFEISLNRESHRNAINMEMMNALSDALNDAERAYIAGTARVIIIRAEGRVFSSGIDLQSFLEESNELGDGWRENLFPTTFRLQAVFNQIENHSLPVICVLHGYCIGLGMELALACDFRIAAERTRMSLPETRLGIIPDVGGTTRLTKIIGPARAKDLIITGRVIDAASAENWGLLHSVVPSDELMTKADALAADILLSAPLAVTYAKRVINEIADTLNDQRKEALAQAYLIQTEDFQNGVHAMLNKEKSITWKGK